MAQPDHLCTSISWRTPASVRRRAQLRAASAPAPCPPWQGSVPAATDAVRYLQRRFGLDLWCMTLLTQGAQTVLASAGPWASTAPPGSVLPWAEALCLPTAGGQGPSVAPDVPVVPVRAGVAQGLPADVQACLGVPIVDVDSALIGTLCAVSGTRQPDGLAEALEPTRLIGRMLSTVLAGEALVRTRSEEAAAAYALAARDPLTGLRNRLGWESALADERARGQRHGGAATVIVVDLDDLKATNDRAGHAAGDDLLVRCAALLTDSSRPADVVARLGGDEFAVLAVQCDAVCARTLQARLRLRLRTAEISASVGTATGWAGEDLALTWQRADGAMYDAKRRRKSAGSTARSTT